MIILEMATLSTNNSLIILYVVVLLTAVHGQDPIVSKQISGCKCETNKGVITLNPIDRTDGAPRFTEPAKDNTGTYSYNPCTPFSTGICKNVLACQSADTQYPLATPSSAYWTNDKTTGKLMITYNATDDTGGVRKMQLQLICDPNVEREFEPSGDSGGNLIYPMKLTSKYACPMPDSGSGSGLSTGSVLCIIFAVLVVVYLVGGALFMSFVKGSRGIEVIPNIDFWKEFPSYVKDGVVFVVYKVKGGSPTKDYQNI